MLLWRTLLAGFAGRWDECQAFAVDARTLGRRLGQPAADVYAIAQFMPVYRHADRIAELEVELRALVAAFPGLPTLSCNLTLLLADTGRHAEAATMLGALVARDVAALPRDQLLLASLAILGEVAVILRDRRTAALLASRLEPYAGAI